MKKFVTFLFVLGFASAFAAEELKITGSTKQLPLNVSVNGIVYGTNYKTVVKDVDGDYSAIRLRPLFNFTDGNIEAVLMLEYDGVFGQYDYQGETEGQETIDSVNKSSEHAGIGADKKGLEVARAYIKSKVDGIPGLFIIGGIVDYDYPLIWGDNAPLAGINYTSNKINLNLYYIKPSEGAMNDSKDDAQIYLADIAFKFGDSSIRPAFFAFQCKDQAEFGQYKDSAGYIYALSMNFVFGIFGMDTAGVFIAGKDKIADTDYSAYAFDIAPYLRPSDAFKTTLFFTMISGDSNKDGGDSFLNATIDGKGEGGINSWRFYIIEDGGSFTTYSDVTNTGKYTNYNGYMAYGLAINFTLGPVTTKIQGGYAQAVKTASGQNKDMGFEIDGNIGFALTRSSTLYVEGAYLKAGKFYETTDTTTGEAGIIEKQNPYYVNVGMTYSI